jgi:hypothetical protein
VCSSDLSIIVAVASYLGGVPGISPTIIAGVIAIGNVLLRLITNQPIGSTNKE